MKKESNQLSLFDTIEGETGPMTVRKVNSSVGKMPCLEWHYLKSHPPAATHTYGVYEGDSFRGVIIFGMPVARSAHVKFQLEPNQCRELLRIALRGHEQPLTIALGKAVKLLKKESPELELLISYADPDAGHVGTIYQAASWIYVGKSAPVQWLEIHGEVVHPRTIFSRYGTDSIKKLKGVDEDAKRVPRSRRHKYVLPLTKSMRKVIQLHKQPYPKRHEIKE